MNSSRPDLVAAGAAALVVGMLVVYLRLIHQQAGEPVAWFVGALVFGAAAAGYGASTGSPHRDAALLVAGLVLTAAGMLAILSIGLPILVAGALCLLASSRARRAPAHS